MCIKNFSKKRFFTERRMEKKLGRLGVSIEHSESRRAGNEMLQNYEETRRNKNIEETRMKLTLPNSL